MYSAEKLTLCHTYSLVEDMNCLIAKTEVLLIEVKTGVHQTHFFDELITE